MIFDLFAEGSSAEGDLRMPKLPEDLARELYCLAHEVGELEPWNTFYDQDWFGIRDPESGEIQIVSILGAAGEVFAIQLYLPDEGIRFWNQFIASGELSHDTVCFDLRMIECEFSGSADILEEDVDLNARYLPPGKRNERTGYVAFRSHRPEFYPWFLEEEDARKMVAALRLVPEFCRHMVTASERYYRIASTGGMPTIPIFELAAKGDPGRIDDWEIRVGLFPVVGPKPLPDPARDDVFDARMAGFKTKPGTTWEVGSFFVPGPIRDRDRLVYPTITMTGVLDGGSAPTPLLGCPDDGRIGQLRKSFAATVEEEGNLPATLLVASPLAEMAFRDLADTSGMEITMVDEFPRLTHFAEEMGTMIANAASGKTEGLFPENIVDFEEDLLAGEARSPADDYREPVSKSRYVMRIDLEGARPPIWRRISLPVDASFFELHVAVQGSMGWHDCHLHCFEIRDGRSLVAQIDWNAEEEEAMPFGFGREKLPEVTTTLREVVERGFKKIHYTYDFGDDWRHRIQIEKVVESETPNPAPEFVTGRGACPPENCGGIWGYNGLLEGNPDFTEGWEPKDLEKIREAKFELTKVSFRSVEEALDRAAMMYKF